MVWPVYAYMTIKLVTLDSIVGGGGECNDVVGEQVYYGTTNGAAPTNINLIHDTNIPAPKTPSSPPHTSSTPHSYHSLILSTPTRQALKLPPSCSTASSTSLCALCIFVIFHFFLFSFLGIFVVRPRDKFVPFSINLSESGKLWLLRLDSQTIHRAIRVTIL